MDGLAAELTSLTVQFLDVAEQNKVTPLHS